MKGLAALVVLSVLCLAFHLAQANADYQQEELLQPEKTLKIAFLASDWTNIPVQLVGGRTQPDFLAGIGFAKVGRAFLYLVCEDQNRPTTSIESAAGQGDRWAQVCWAATLYYVTAKSKEKAAAVKLLRQAADSGYSPAMFNLAVLGEAGEDPQSTPEEVDKLLRAVAGDIGVSQPSRIASAAAEFMLGRKHYWGAGVQRNLVETHARWSVALGTGLLPSTEAVSELERSMTPEQIAEAKQLASQRSKR